MCNESQQGKSMTSLSRFSYTLKSKFIAFALGDANVHRMDLNLKYNIEVNQLNHYYVSLHALLS